MKNWSNPEIKNLGLALTETQEGYVFDKNNTPVTSNPNSRGVTGGICPPYGWKCLVPGCHAKHDKTFENWCDAFRSLKDHWATHLPCGES